MQGMIKQTVSKKARPFWQVIIVVLLYVIGVNYLITLCNTLGGKYINIASLLILFFSLVVVALIIYRFLSKYMYLLIDDKIVFQKHIGNQNKKVLEIKLEEIQYLKPYKEIQSQKDIAHTYKFVCDREYDKFYVGEFMRDCKRYRFVFKPSERMINVLCRKIKETVV